MDRMIYINMSGSKQAELAQASNNHNLANVNTTGFRKDIDAFSSLPVYGPGHPGRVYAQDERAGIDFNSGHILQTGRELDVAINGDGFIEIQAPDGTPAYTRAGNLRINEVGLLENGAGHPVMGNGGPIATPPYSKLEIGADGTISIQPLGQAPNTLAVLDRIKLVNPPVAELEKGKDGLLRTRNGIPAQADAVVKITAGALESSNVNAVESMVTMIELSRQYEMHVKMMKTAEENDAAAAALLRLS